MFLEFKQLEPYKQENNLFIFNRGFSDARLIELLDNSNVFYLFRLKSGAFKFLDNISSNDEIITHISNSFKEPYEKGNKSNNSCKKRKIQFTTRIITVTLSSGQKEILMTNIFDESHECDFF